jgi:cytochrome c553
VSGRRLLLAAAIAGAVAGCRQDMHDQPKYKPLRESELFDDQRSARPLVAGTIARGMLREDEALYSGKSGGEFVSELPLPLTPQLLARGQERFQIFCSPCHGRTGRGDGMVVRRGFKPPPSYHIERLRAAPLGYFYDVVTNGFGAMPDYASQVPPEDRWAIAAYIRTLQYSQYAPLADVPAEKRGELDRSTSATTAPEARH